MKAKHKRKIGFFDNIFKNPNRTKPEKDYIIPEDTKSTVASSNFILLLKLEVENIISLEKNSKFPFFRRFSFKKKERLISSLVHTELERLHSLKEVILLSEFKDLLKDTFYRNSLKQSLRQIELINTYRYKLENNLLD